eukprot:665793-Pelagomonas_calceolata.AAC.1
MRERVHQACMRESVHQACMRESVHQVPGCTTGQGGSGSYAQQHAYTHRSERKQVTCSAACIHTQVREEAGHMLSSMRTSTGQRGSRLLAQQHAYKHKSEQRGGRSLS